MADEITRPTSARILNKGRGQRVQILTFSGEVQLNNVLSINASNSAPTLVSKRHVRQELSDGFVTARDDADPNSNGHFKVESSS